LQRSRAATFEEYVRWYLGRERRKGRPGADLNTASWEAIAAEMRDTHPGKLRAWFEGAEWSVVTLDEPQDALTLVCVDNTETRRNRLVIGSAPNNRLARNVILAAHTHQHFENEEVCRAASRRSQPPFEGNERLVLCSLNEDERRQNPDASYYLHDGFGRLLPWLYAVVYEGRPYQPAEAFLALNRRSAPLGSR
jgi:hypothetical protein